MVIHEKNRRAKAVCSEQQIRDAESIAEAIWNNNALTRDQIYIIATWLLMEP